MNTVRIVVIDEQPLFRRKVIDFFSQEPGFRVVGEAGASTEAVRLIRELCPEVALVAAQLPDSVGQEIIRRFTAEKASIYFILLTPNDDPDLQIQAIREGARAACTQDIELDMLGRIIRAVADGRYVLGGHILDPLGLERSLRVMQEGSPSRPRRAAREASILSVREMQVLEQITYGLSNKEIAHNLEISHQTVKNHVTSILRKLGVEDRTQATIYALRKGWVSL
jgi:DNA-binding NarL/FixJ family response regulator